jgi:hypothetical protein
VELVRGNELSLTTDYTVKGRGLHSSIDERQGENRYLLYINADASVSHGLKLVYFSAQCKYLSGDTLVGSVTKMRMIQPKNCESICPW